MSGISQISNRADINQVLAEMRALKSQVQRPTLDQVEPNPNAIKPSSTVENSPSFGDLLARSVNAVNDTQMQASKMATAYEQGDPNVDITQVMIQSQKASVSFQALTQVRNKVVQAYEDIMKMPI